MKCQYCKVNPVRSGQSTCYLMTCFDKQANELRHEIEVLSEAESKFRLEIRALYSKSDRLHEAVLTSLKTSKLFIGLSLFLSIALAVVILSF